MLTYQINRRVASLLPLLGLLVLGLSFSSPAQAQERRYLFEVGAAGAYQGYGSEADLGGSAGGLVRAGIWLPLNFSVEVEGSLASPNAQRANTGISVKAGWAAVLYNVLLGSRNSAYGKLGLGGTDYGNPEDCSGPRICGTTTTWVAGLGLRVGLTPLILLRSEVVLLPNSGQSIEITPTGADTTDVSFTNYGLNVGLSFMLGSKPIPDSDDDGILNNRDRCTDTPSGAQVDGFGCPADNDGDGVANGIDRCPNTAVGAIVDAIGCTRDSDGDNIADGIDKCPDSPTGVLVDATGCPRDSDSDGIADGLDRCSATPRGATVDALGCPGDEDADGVLDGLDRCPRTAIGAAVNSRGCASGQQGRQPAAAPPPSPPAPEPAQPAPRVATPAPSPVGGAPMVLQGVSFESGSARMQPGSYVELDSVAKVLLSNPNLRIEIGGHTDNAGTPADNQHLSTLRAEAVRNYLVAKGVPFQQMVARGYGSTVPRTPDTTPQGRAANRRVEIRPLPPEQ
ncbi:MAG TPA: OmpA family protein [Gemmatimonadales bacterium]|nr:OmpA family protein [Gemmatimonadales bacterium]